MHITSSLPLVHYSCHVTSLSRDEGVPLRVGLLYTTMHVQDCVFDGGILWLEPIYNRINVRALMT